ncbi:DUF6861 domain-containing protein [Anthocerotibacter panamensis]|uniref:DUF6861 domain-containing protein n=1 Tax=Anthocerotibacter panamensis TaxID=2857077 RepID=UPI001C4031C4|nr:hypothetical protein [Anthocerotibacter panamensis]
MSIYESRKPKSSSSNHIPQPPKASTFKPPVVQTQPVEDGEVMPKMTSAADWWRSSGLVHEAGLAGLQFKLTLGQPADQYEQEADRVVQAQPEEVAGMPKMTSAADWWRSSGLVHEAGLAGLQFKLTIGQPADQYEQEADRVAAQVVSQINAPQPSQQVQRQQQTEPSLTQPGAQVLAHQLQREPQLEAPTLGKDKDIAQQSFQKLSDLKEAVVRSAEYLPQAVGARVEESLRGVLIGLMIALVGAVGIVAVTTAVGAALGALAGGVGALPGAAAGAQVGVAILEWLGLGMLALWLGERLVQLGEQFASFIATAWSADGDQQAIDRAAHAFADAVGVLLVLILEAIVLWATQKGLTQVLAELKKTRFGQWIGESRLAEWLRGQLRVPPLNAKSLVIDSNVVIALNKLKQGLPLQAGEQALVNRFNTLGDVEVRLTDTTIAEVKDAKITFKEVPLTVQRTSPEYQAILQVLEKANVGKAKGVNDRAIVADVFFSRAEPGVTPKLATMDPGIFNNLAVIAGINPAKLGKSIPDIYPNGFNVTIQGRTIQVIPLPKK